MTDQRSAASDLRRLAERVVEANYDTAGLDGFAKQPVYTAIADLEQHLRATGSWKEVEASG